MRWSLIVLLSLAAAGCACKPVPHPGQTHLAYQESPAPALVFSSPVSIGQPPIMLAREDRAPAAFVGFEDLSTTFFYIRLDDYIDRDGFTWPLRRAISERVGTSYR